MRNVEVTAWTWRTGWWSRVEVKLTDLEKVRNLKAEALVSEVTGKSCRVMARMEVEGMWVGSHFFNFINFLNEIWGVTRRRLMTEMRDKKWYSWMASFKWSGISNRGWRIRIWEQCWRRRVLIPLPTPRHSDGTTLSLWGGNASSLMKCFTWPKP